MDFYLSCWGEGLWVMLKKRRFKKFLYYIFVFIGFAMDMTLKINYSFSMLSIFIGQILCKEKLDQITKLDYFLGLVVLPVLLKLFFNLLHN